MRLVEKIVLVTGAQQGIGRGMALAFARDGADIGINYLDDRAAADAVASEVRARGRRAILLHADVSRPDQVQTMVAELVERLGPPDVLVNNAGVFPRVPFLTMRDADWDYVLGTNLTGSFLCGRAVAQAMVASGRGGAILNISSSAIRGDPLGVHYSASKTGVIGLTRAMALALAPHRVRVNAIAPGLTDTAQPRYGHSEEALEALGRAIPLGRLAQPDDIASVAVFLASDEARFVTGQIIHVNGGSYMA